MAVWMDLLLASAALLPWVMQYKAKRSSGPALTPVAVKREAEPEGLPRQAQEF
jgi:hypothetical protein